MLDVGTGGGLPGIPLAILHPDANFLLVDRVGKRYAVQEMADRIGLKNVRAEQMHAKDAPGPFDFVVSRAVTRLPSSSLGSKRTSGWNRRIHFPMASCI